MSKPKTVEGVSNKADENCCDIGRGAIAAIGWLAEKPCAARLLRTYTSRNYLTAELRTEFWPRRYSGGSANPVSE